MRQFFLDRLLLVKQSLRYEIFSHSRRCVEGALRNDGCNRYYVGNVKTKVFGACIIMTEKDFDWSINNPVAPSGVPSDAAVQSQSDGAVFSNSSLQPPAGVLRLIGVKKLFLSEDSGEFFERPIMFGRDMPWPAEMSDTERGAIEIEYARVEGSRFAAPIDYYRVHAKLKLASDLFDASRSDGMRFTLPRDIIAHANVDCFRQLTPPEHFFRMRRVWMILQYAAIAVSALTACGTYLFWTMHR
jgi:hypothetical protein